MIRFVSHLLRFVLILAGFIFAVVAASAFMLFLAWGGLTHGDPQSERLMTIAAGLSLPVLVAFAGYYSFAPAFAFSVIAEISGRRSWLFHAVGGMVVAIAALAIRSDAPLRSGLGLVVLAAGAVGGTVYWLIAGRSSGKHLDEAAADPTSE